MAAALIVAPLALGLAGCGGGATVSGSGAQRPGVIEAVGAESQYADVISQVGGRYVAVTAVMNNPNTDPHAFEASPSVARAVASARLVVQNGLGYDGFMNKLESASAGRARRVIDVRSLLGLPESTRNPHLWYEPRTMPAVAAAVGRDLAAIAPAHARYFTANVRRFDRALEPWLRALASFRARHAGAPVATTEPVADYLLSAAGTRNLTPWNLQADLMNGVDPAPQDLTAEDDLLAHRRVRALIYNRQVTDTVTQSFVQLARQHHIPVVAVYETMPSGYSYQSWMLAELAALARAVTTGESTTVLR